MCVWLVTEDSGQSKYLKTFSYADGASSYSFGLLQFDVGGNPNAQTFLANSNYFSTQQIQELEQHGGLSSSVTNALNSELQAYLSTSSGTTAMTNLIDNTLAGYYTTFDGLISNASPDIAGALYSDPVALQHVFDYLNQFPAPFNSLQSFLQGNQVQQPGGGVAQWNPNDSADQNIENYFYSTKWAIQNPDAADERESEFYQGIADEDVTQQI